MDFKYSGNGFKLGVRGADPAQFDRVMSFIEKAYEGMYLKCEVGPADLKADNLPWGLSVIKPLIDEQINKPVAWGIGETEKPVPLDLSEWTPTSSLFKIPNLFAQAVDAVIEDEPLLAKNADSAFNDEGYDHAYADTVKDWMAGSAYNIGPGPMSNAAYEQEERRLAIEAAEKYEREQRELQAAVVDPDPGYQETAAATETANEPTWQPTIEQLHTRPRRVELLNSEHTLRPTLAERWPAAMAALLQETVESGEHYSTGIKFSTFEHGTDADGLPKPKPLYRASYICVNTKCRKAGIRFIAEDSRYIKCHHCNTRMNYEQAGDETPMNDEKCYYKATTAHSHQPSRRH